MYLQYRYTNDTRYLQNTAYPFMREVVKFYQSQVLSCDAGTGKYYMATLERARDVLGRPTRSPTWPRCGCCSRSTIQVSNQLGLDAALRARWQDVLDSLEPYQVQQRRVAAARPAGAGPAAQRRERRRPS